MLIALGGFTSGSVTSSGGDGIILSEGDIAGSLNVANDGGLLAYGNISGSHSAGHDIGAFAYGSFNGNLSAGNDVTSVTTGGDLLGSITADHNIGGNSTGFIGGGIFSYGQINANISALNASSDPEGGFIDTVSAVGEISGSITAAGTLQSVVSGADIFATLSAGMLGTQTAWDSNLAGQTPPPAPASIVPDLLTQVATARAAVVDDKNDSYNEFTLLLNDVATAQADAASDIATAYSDVVSQTATAIGDSATALSNAQSEAVGQFGVTQADLDRATARASAVDNSEYQFDTNLATQATERDTARNNAGLDAAQLALKIGYSRVDITLDKDKAADELSDKLDEERDWDGKWTARFMSVLDALSDPTTPIKLVREKFEQMGQQWDQISALADVAQTTGVRRYYMIVGAIVADMVGLRQLVGAFDGADPYTLQKWSTAERVLNGALGGFQLITTAMGISQFMSRMG